MRLIDADKFKEWIDAGHLRNPLEQCLSELNVISMIDAQPTAYDVYKVAEQLEENAVCSGNKESGFLLLHKAVSIVKGAVKDE